MYGIFVKCLEKSYLPGKKEMSGKIMKCLEFLKMSGKKLFTLKERNVWKNNEMSGIF